MTAEIAALKACASAASTSWLLAERKLEAVRKAVRSTAKELASARSRLNGARATAAARAASMYKQRGVTLADVLVGSGSFGEMVSEIRFYARLADYDHDITAALRDAESQVSAKHEQLVAARGAARVLVAQRKQELARTRLAVSAGQSKLVGLQSQIKEMQAVLRQPSPAATSSQTAETVATAEVTTPTASPAAAAPSGGWWSQIQAAASANGISAQGLYKLMMIESGGIQTIVGGGQFCGLFQYWSGTWKASWNPYRASSIFDGSAQIKATALAIGMGKGPYWWPGSYQHAFGGN